MRCDVALRIAREFLCPELNIRLGALLALRAAVPVPKTAMNKNCDAQPGKHYVGGSREVLLMQPETEARRVEVTPNNAFG